MGTAKALLPLGPELMLQRVVRLIGEVVPNSNIVVVAVTGQQLPSLPNGVEITYDRYENRGPLEGLAAGMRALSDRADAVYASSCDVPLLVPAFVAQMFKLLGDEELAVTKDGKFYHPLAAVYRMSVLEQIQQLLDENRLRTAGLFAQVEGREIPIDDLRVVDAELATLENINRPDDYQRARQRLGL